MEELLQVGIIANTHGVRGEVKVFPTTDDAARFDKLKEVILDTGEQKTTLHIMERKYHKNMVILRFREFVNINEVEKFKGNGLFVTRENAVPLQKDEYFIADMIGLNVVEEDGEVLGELSDVLTTGANDVYIIKKENTPDLLIPAIKECILDVDMETGIMTVHLLPGLRE
ncbi:MAG: 16S rRNA processing protein RimM [Eubacterium sp.]|nr:16S rRNA processing protein RimM [Eubacterium sp.]